MLNLTRNQQILIGIALALLIIMTRGHHFASINALPSASLAVFFLAGFYLRATWVPLALIGLCAGLDFYSVTFAGTSSFCVTPAYGFLLPAYGTIWLAGRWFSKRYMFSAKTLLPLAGGVGVASLVSELFSSGGFYFFGGRYPNPTIAEFLPRIAKYFPQQLEGIAFWLVVATIVHVAFVLTVQARRADA